MPTFRVRTMWHIDILRTFEIEAENAHEADNMISRSIDRGEFTRDFTECSGGLCFDEVIEAEEV